jgi:putative mRNA 3-end processing factor
VDWPALLDSVAATGAERVWVTHGYREPVVRWLREHGLQAEAVASRWEGEPESEPVVQDEQESVEGEGSEEPGR